MSLLRAPWIGDDPQGSGSDALFRLVASRDEQRDRPEALPPRRTRSERFDVLAPVDPLGGGTWIAASSAGLVFVILNEYGAGDASDQTGRQSRGLVIPALVGSASLADARARASTLDPRSFLPFRLLVVDRHGLVEVLADGRTLVVTDRDANSPRVLRCSSRVDEPRARACRTALFDRLVTGPSREAQDTFHRATWPANEALGVLMSRPDATTVSITTVDVFEHQVSMTYCAMSPRAQPPVTEHLRIA